MAIVSRFMKVAVSTCCAVTLTCGGYGFVFADDAKPAPAPAANPPAAPPETPADPFAVPEGSDAEAVLNFIQGLVRGFQTRPADDRTQEKTVGYLNKMDKSLETVLTRNLDEETAVLSVNVRLQVLSALAQLGDETAQKRADDQVAMLAKSSVPALKSMGERFQLMAELQKIPDMKPEERSQLVAKLAEKLKTPDLQPDHIMLATQAADMLEAIDETKAAAEAYNLFAKVLESRNEERLKEPIEGLRGTARRLNLPGNAIEIKGTTVDGKPFDITQLKGKVVLVDFWATWCGPCIAEMPNVKQNYELYHDKGFEVVGISLDDNPEALAEFLKDQKTPWVTLFPEKEDERGWANPIARYYGINGIPTVILVDQTGKVISLNARGPLLGAKLAELLGPVEKPAAP